MDTIYADAINNMNLDTYKWIIPIIISIVALFAAFLIYLLKNRDDKIKDLNKEVRQLKEINKGSAEGSKLPIQDGIIIPKNDDQLWHEVNDAVTNIVEQIEKDEFEPSIIIGIGRGGGIFGSLVSYKLYHVPIFIIDREYDRKTGNRKQNVLFDFEIPAFYMDKILLVAGEAHLGATLTCFENHLRKKGAGVIKTCVFYKQTICGKKIDYYCKEGEGNSLMPWQDKDYIRDSIDSENLETLKKWREKISRMEGKTIYIIRHGETDHNKNDVFIGITPSSLNATGEQQINKLGEYMNINEFLRANNTVIISSDQDRGVQTSNIIANKIGIKGDRIIHIPELRERDYGEWEGKNRQQIISEYGSEYEKYEKDALQYCPPGAERIAMLPRDDEKPSSKESNVINRTQRVFELIANQEAENIVIVTHKTTGRLLLSYFTRSFYSKYREIDFDNGSLSKFTIKEGEIKTVYLNNKDFQN